MGDVGQPILAAPHSSGKPQTVSIGRIPWRPHSPKRQRGDGLANKPVPALRLRSCEKIGKSGTDSPFRDGQLRIFKRLRGAKKVSGPGFSIFSQLLTLGAMWESSRRAMKT